MVGGSAALFSPYVCEQIGYYVYLLLDGEDVFYVGKGKGNRVFDHARGAPLPIEGETPESLKIQRIQSIRSADRGVDVLLVRHGLTEPEAFLVESVLIDLSSRPISSKLTNIAGGHRANTLGYMTAAEVIQLYDAPPIELDDTPLIFLRIPRLWYRGIDPADLFEATRGWWLLNPRRAEQARYVMAVSRGVVREVYEADRWYARERGALGWTDAELRRQRFGFDGSVAAADADRWRHRNVVSLFPKGYQGPVRYHRC